MRRIAAVLRAPRHSVATLALLMAAATGPAHALEGGRIASGPAAAAAVAVETVSPEGGHTRYGHCTGVVVAPAAVLTAAHCVDGIPPARVAVFRFVAGRAAPPVIGVSAVIRDPAAQARWASRPGTAAERQAALAADLAVLRLAAPLDGVALPLAAAGAPPGPLRLLAGGAAGPRRPPSGEIKAVALGRLYLTRTGPPLAFASPEHGRVCPGDSGGPVIADTSAGPVLWGLVGGVLPGRGGCSVRAVIVRLGEAAALVRRMAAP